MKGEKDPMMRDQKTLRQPTKRKLHLKKIPRILLKLWVHCNRWFIFSKLALYNTWQLAIQQSHETFKTPLPHGDQASCIKRQTFGVFQHKKCKHKEQKQLLKATTSSKVSAPRASFLVVNLIAKTKPFPTWRVDPASCQGRLSWTLRGCSSKGGTCCSFS